jgi:hypothetical protein
VLFGRAPLVVVYFGLGNVAEAVERSTASAEERFEARRIYLPGV